MAERGKGFFQSFLTGWGGGRQREGLVELLLMAALADGHASTAELDRIARAIETQDALRGMDWGWVLTRRAEIANDGPLFSETRERLVRNLKDPELRRSGLSLAAQFLGSPLAEEERALLVAVADGFEIPPAEREALFAPWAEADPFQAGYVRCAFDNPDAGRSAPFFDALAHTENDAELALLAFKLVAVRAAMTRLSEDAALAALGEVLEVDGSRFRVDAYITSPDRNWVARFLAKGEALFPREHELLPQILRRMDPTVSVFIGYADSLALPDDAALRRMDPIRLVVEKLVI